MLLALDYPGLRTQARIADLGLAGLVDLLVAPLPLAASGSGYTGELLARVPGAQARAVLGYCASAPLAAGLAARLSNPPLILFDAETVGARTVRDAYRSMAGQLGVLVSDQDVERLGDPSGEPETFLASARTDLRDRVRTALLGDGCPAAGVEDFVTELTGACLAWLAHLVAAADAGPVRSAGPVLRVVSRERPGGDVTIDCAADDLLRHLATRAAVRSFLAANPR